MAVERLWFIPLPLDRNRQADNLHSLTQFPAVVTSGPENQIQAYEEKRISGALPLLIT